MGLLEGKVAIVTGGGGGIGRGVCRRFVQEGAAVVVAEINDAARAAVLAELEEMGGRVVALHADVSRKDDVRAVVQAAVDRFGGVDILVNNAFTLQPRKLIEHKTDAILDAQLKSGVWAAWWAMQASRASMAARGGGAVVNFSSIEVQTGAWQDSDYIINKSAIEGLTRSAASEWGRFGIRVNAIRPMAAGAHFLKMVADNPEIGRLSALRKPLNRNGDPEKDIAPVVLFLASDMSRYITGELIHVDGGLHMPGYDSRPPNLAELELEDDLY